MNLLTWRKKNGKSVTEAARHFGVSTAVYIRHESGQRFPRPRFLDNYLKKSDGLVTPNDFYGGTYFAGEDAVPPESCRLGAGGRRGGMTLLYRPPDGS